MARGDRLARGAVSGSQDGQALQHGARGDVSGAGLGWVKLSPSFVEPAIVATIMLAAFDNLWPLLFALRRRTVYLPLVLRAGSGLALPMAAVWLVERTSDWRLLPT